MRIAPQAKFFTEEDMEGVDKTRVGVLVGSGMGGLKVIEDNVCRERALRRRVRSVLGRVEQCRHRIRMYESLTQ